MVVYLKTLEDAAKQGSLELHDPVRAALFEAGMAHIVGQGVSPRNREPQRSPRPNQHPVSLAACRR